MGDTILIPANGVQLECQVIKHTGPSTSPVAVVFHPWAWLGGCMWDAVVGNLTRSCVESGLFRAVVRYNMRGTGGSSGFKSWSASTDGDDAAALVNALTFGAGGIPAICGDSNPSFALIAYSYGSCVAAEAIQAGIKDKTVAYVSVGFPLGLLSKWFLRSHSSWTSLMQSRLPTQSHTQTVGSAGTPADKDERVSVSGAPPMLLVMGTSDQFTDISTLEKLVKDANDSSPSSSVVDVAVGVQSELHSRPQPSTLELHVVDGADHFCWGPELGDIVVDWLSRNMEGRE